MQIADIGAAEDTANKETITISTWSPTARLRAAFVVSKIILWRTWKGTNVLIIRLEVKTPGTEPIYKTYFVEFLQKSTSDFIYFFIYHFNNYLYT